MLEQGRFRTGAKFGRTYYKFNDHVRHDWRRGAAFGHLGLHL